MKRERDSFVGIDLGGPRGKTTALARLRGRGGTLPAVVEEVDTRGPGGEPWHDEALVDYLAGLQSAVVAIDAPLTAPACVRCQLPRCPGAEVCEVPSVVWLRTRGAELQARADMADRDRIAAIPSSHGFSSSSGEPAPRRRLAPYTHRCTEVHHHYTRDLVRRETLSRGPGPISARAAYLRRVLATHGYELNHSLIEVSPRSTVQALFGHRRARGYKRDADPWVTRAAILEDLAGDLEFSPKSRLAKDEVLRNDHCFDALLSGYTAYLWARDGWTMPAGDEPIFAEDGWIWVPPDK